MKLYVIFDSGNSSGTYHCDAFSLTCGELLLYSVTKNPYQISYKIKERLPHVTAVESVEG